MGSTIDWWQHLPQHISPVIFEIGWFKLQYYGLMYIVAFAITYGLAYYRLRREKRFQINVDQLQALMTAMIIGLIIAWLPIWLGVLLWQGADKAEQAETSGNEQDAVEALNKIRTIFTIYGVLALIGLIVSVVYIIVVIAVIAGGGIELDTLGGFTSR